MAREGNEMTISRFYLMTAKEDHVGALHEALIGLAEKVRALPGCEGVEIGQEAEDPHRFHFVERWGSIEAHVEGGKMLGKAAIAGVRAAVALPPYGTYLNAVK